MLQKNLNTYTVWIFYWRLLKYYIFLLAFYLRKKKNLSNGFRKKIYEIDYILLNIIIRSIICINAII